MGSELVEREFPELRFRNLRRLEAFLDFADRVLVLVVPLLDELVYLLDPGVQVLLLEAGVDNILELEEGGLKGRRDLVEYVVLEDLLFLRKGLELGANEIF